MAVVTGHGATLAFGTTTAWAGLHVDWLDEPGAPRSRFVASRHDRSADQAAWRPVRAKPIHGVVFFEPEASDNPFDTLLFDTGVGAAAETISLTYPTATTLTGAGSGFVTGFEIGELVTDQLMTATITVQYADWPTFS